MSRALLLLVGDRFHRVDLTPLPNGYGARKWFGTTNGVATGEPVTTPSRAGRRQYTNLPTVVRRSAAMRDSSSTAVRVWVSAWVVESAAVAAIEEISTIVAQISDRQTTIASAVEEQTATTNEIGRSVAEAATGSADIAQNITGVARTAADTGGAAASTSQAADELARMAAEMRQLVGQFKY